MMGGVENVRCNMMMRRSGKRNQLREVDWMHVLGLGLEEGPGDGDRWTGPGERMLGGVCLWLRLG